MRVNVIIRNHFKFEQCKDTDVVTNARYRATILFLVGLPETKIPSRQNLQRCNAVYISTEDSLFNALAITIKVEMSIVEIYCNFREIMFHCP